jgi:hypothetical protein
MYSSVRNIGLERSPGTSKGVGWGWPVNTTTQIVLTLMSSIPAIIIAWLAFRSSKATSDTAIPVAEVNVGPNAQEQINAGFQLLLAAQAGELAELRFMVSTLMGYTQVSSAWHVDHVKGFDDPAKRIIEQTAPEKLIHLDLKPFPAWEDYRNAHSRPDPKRT